MPELPEVETVRRGLEAVLPGRRVERLSVTGRRAVRRQPAAELRRRVTGRSFVRADRRGKYLALVLDDGQVVVVHLRMSGQLLYVPEPAGLPLQPHTHVVVRLDDGSELRFVDPRTFGEWFVTGEVRRDGLPAEFDRLGPDPLCDGLSAARLAQRLARRRSPLKAALTDQAVVAGIGSLYADEICHAAGVLPSRPCESLTGAEVAALAGATRRILRRAVEMRGSSLRDARYRDLMGELGGYQARHRVYGRAGTPCPRCGATLRRVIIGARSAYCCTGCQH
ncbi:MAG TPA: bifunctional DNA-formamidopyrimidine glycosylase/DNA-(apurinic or apyrimidinic site) lyase [Acidimicrobiales bacterium]|nr:bifunctional DNA-formamidopyrimidine glycosylase/DNA-(apurinic or apyrimidinic site) lyase [Acidimicrobiales bacterium]